ncbi:HIRAN domain-containing protein [Hyphobacterium marinum]|uniref:HIRAN domain-containing protein n=1 Tax=Hyphobacterium marinum TaxID=3116574 RepID=A0ABU7LYI4_9PROT|nr:HIRAN domain-containing protein [Hyphobacterium sp. Y6023]MEE2566070.1 HIRAN domain-containing protein [Hyphobacterium sp. Y6023]
MNDIKNVIDWDSLKLVWQSADPKHRSHYHVATITREAAGVKLKYEAESDDFREASKHGFIGYPAFDFKKSQVYTTGVVNTFARRLPPKERDDYWKYLESFKLPATRQYSTMTLLGYSSGRLPSDGFSFVPVIRAQDAPFELMLEVVGYRHSAATNMSAERFIGAHIEFRKDDKNRYDPNAVRVQAAGTHIGYVNRTMAMMIRELMDNDRIQLNGSIVRVNGTSARPRPYIFLSAKRTITDQKFKTNGVDSNAA